MVKQLNKDARILNARLILLLVIIGTLVYLIYSFQDYSILIIAIGLIILIGYWLLDAYGNEGMH